ncbi:MAG: AAA domain-containing protein, partial [Nitrosomonadaceae bacterium]
MAIGQERTLALIEYTQQTALMRDKPTSNVTAHMFHRHENSLAGLPGVHLNVSLEDREDEVWLVVNRLHETKPPEPTTNFLKAWIKLSNTPFEEPELKAHIEIQKLIDLGLEVLPELDSDIEDSEPFNPKQLVFLDTFENRDEVKTHLKVYVNNLWSPWAINEKSRRESIGFYATLFTLKQQLEDSIVESQLELVWGVGIAVWKMGDVSVSYPLVSRLVELSFNELTMDIVVRPRNIDSRMELEIYPAEYNQAVTNLEHIAKDFFSRTQRVRPRDIDSRLELEMYFSEYNQGVTDLERIAKDSFPRTQNTFSPFDRASFEPLLRLAVTHLDSQGVFWPTQTTPDDRALPKADNALKVTDTWVLFARPRSNSLFIQDLDRLKKQVEESLELPSALTAIVTDPATKRTERELPSFRGLCNVHRSTRESSNLTKASDLFFLKPYNKEQARIIQMLEHSPGVVVQGPPSTGKTHTIANIIGHSLAQGHRVLVTSMRVPALAVLHEHLPKEIQPLAISLLSSEKEGMKQFECAVEKIAAEIQGIDRTSLGREISLLESHIDSLHGWLVKIYRSISKWAFSNLSKLDIDGELIDPLDAAKELVRKKVSFEWIDDELTIRREHASQFTDNHIIELRKVRRLLGKDLDYLGKKLPQISEFPDSRDLLKVHQDLSQLSKLKEELEQGTFSIMSNSSKEIYQLAASLVKLISYLKNLKSELGQSEHNWHRILRIKLKIGHSRDMFQMFEKLANDLDSTVADSKRFLEKPVETPNDIDLEHELVLGLRNLAAGKSAFGMAGLIIKGALKKKLQQIKLLGAKPNGNEEWAHVLEYVEHLKKLRALVTRWNALASEVSVAQLPANNPKHFYQAVEALAIYRKTKIMIAVEQEIDDKANVVLPSWNHGSD